MKLYNSLIPMYQLQGVEQDVVEASVFSNYVDMTRRYPCDRASITDRDSIEVRFEDIESNPLEVPQQIYTELCLPGRE